MPTDEKAEGTAASASDPETAYMEGLNARLRGEAKDDDEAPPADEDKKDEPVEEAAEDDDADADAAEDESEDKEPEAAEEDADEDEDEVDKDALRKLQKEKRSFERVKTEVLALERDVKEREQRVGKAEAGWKAFLSEFDVRPVETLLESGRLDQAAIDYLARQLFLHTTDAKKDPRSKVEAERLQRERARDREARMANERVSRLEREREEERAAAQGERDLKNYVSNIDTSIETYRAKTPLLTKALAKDPAETKREVYAVAYELAQANNGQFVEPGKALLTWEKRERARLERLGFTAQAAAPPSGTQDKKAKSKTAAKSQGQGDTKKTDATADSDDEPVLEGEAYMAELRRRLKRSG
jgi:hypothetical protein